MVVILLCPFVVRRWSSRSWYVFFFVNEASILRVAIVVYLFTHCAAIRNLFFLRFNMHRAGEGGMCGLFACVGESNKCFKTVHVLRNAAMIRMKCVYVLWMCSGSVKLIICVT